MKREEVRDTVSKRTPKNPQNIFCQFWNISKIRKIINNQEGTPGGQKTPGRAWQPGAPRWVVPTLGTYRTPFFFLFFFTKIKIFIYPPPEPIDHRIMEKS